MLNELHITLKEEHAGQIASVGRVRYTLVMISCICYFYYVQHDRVRCTCLRDTSHHRQLNQAFGLGSKEAEGGPNRAITAFWPEIRFTLVVSWWILTRSGTVRLTKITEVLVLQIRLILVRGDAGIISRITLGESLVPALVGNHKGQAEQQDHHDLQGQLVCSLLREIITAHLGDTRSHADRDTGSVGRLLRVEKGVRTDDIAQTHTDKGDGGGHELFGVAASVTVDQGEGEGEDCVRGPGEVCTSVIATPITIARSLTVADQFGRLVLAVCHHDESGDDNEQNGSHQVGTNVEVVRLVANVHAGDTAMSVEEPCETSCLLR